MDAFEEADRAVKSLPKAKDPYAVILDVRSFSPRPRATGVCAASSRFALQRLIPDQPDTNRPRSAWTQLSTGRRGMESGTLPATRLIPNEPPAKIAAGIGMPTHSIAATPGRSARTAPSFRAPSPR